MNLNSPDIAICSNHVALTVKEVELLRFMVMRKGQVLTKTTLLNHLYPRDDQPDAKIIDVFICKLRKKLAQAGAGELIRTVWGRGYTVWDPSGGGSHQPCVEDDEALHIVEVAA